MSASVQIKPKFLSSRNQISVVAAGFSGGQTKPGVEGAPAALLDAGLLEQLQTDLDLNVAFDGKVHTFAELPTSGLGLGTPMTASSIEQIDPPHRGMRRPRHVSAATQRIAELVHEHALQGKLVLTLGGDHSIGVGTVCGVASATRKRIGKETAVIWVDAHPDINGPEDSDSGNIHGMPVAFATGLATSNEPGIFDWIKSDHLLNPQKLVYIGLRSVDRPEKQIIAKHAIKAFSMHDVDRYGIGRVVEMALEHIGPDTPIHLSFDVDAMDPMYAPSTGTPVRGGLTLREADYIAESVAATGSLVALDLVEVNPDLQSQGAQDTVSAGISIVRCALGDTLL